MDRATRRAIERESLKFPRELVEVPRDQWPGHLQSGPTRRAWRSRTFLVQQYDAPAPAIARLSVNRVLGSAAGWDAGVTWDELQRLKREAGYGEAWAVEIFPADADIVNVANMRHLWLLPETPAFAWTA